MIRILTTITMNPKSKRYKMPPLTRKELLEKNEQIWQLVSRGLDEAAQESLNEFIQEQVDRRRIDRAKKEQRERDAESRQKEERPVGV